MTTSQPAAAEAVFATIQPAQWPTGVLPYPFHTTQDGAITRQDFWQGEPARVVGFTTAPDRFEVVLDWDDFAADPQQAVGMYTITANGPGEFSTHLTAVETVTTW